MTSLFKSFIQNNNQIPAVTQDVKTTNKETVSVKDQPKSPTNDLDGKDHKDPLQGGCHKPKNPYVMRKHDHDITTN